VYDPSSFFYPPALGCQKTTLFFGAANIIELEESFHEQDNWTASSKGFLPQQPSRKGTNTWDKMKHTHSFTPSDPLHLL